MNERGKLSPAPPPVTSSQIEIGKVCEEVWHMLLEKNRKYGDSAIYPLRLFCKADALTQLDVRIDDKISRIKSRQDDEDEDVEMDLIGYLILKQVAKRIIKDRNP